MKKGHIGKPDFTWGLYAPIELQHLQDTRRSARSGRVAERSQERQLVR
jgi:hypothetical protein